jgi:DNA-binding MarR family transcriptional regulator
MVTMEEWKRRKGRTPEGKAFTALVLEVFRLHGRLRAAGDRLGRGLELTSARWQVLGAIDDGPLPVVQIARNMGLSRQAVQRVTNELDASGLVEFAANPDHRRAKLVRLTGAGRRALDRVSARQVTWSNRIAEAAAAEDIECAVTTLHALRARLERAGP